MATNMHHDVPPRIDKSNDAHHTALLYGEHGLEMNVVALLTSYPSRLVVPYPAPEARPSYHFPHPTPQNTLRDFLQRTPREQHAVAATAQPVEFRPQASGPSTCLLLSLPRPERPVVVATVTVGYFHAGNRVLDNKDMHTWYKVPKAERDAEVESDLNKSDPMPRKTYRPQLHRLGWGKW